MMKYIKLVVISFLLLFSTFAVANECRVTILHFNDFHGQLETPKKGLGGGERLAALIAKIDQENLAAGRHTILMMGGDLISGTPVSEKFKGEAEFRFLKEIGTEAMVIGNHDFDFGVEALKENIKKSDVPVLSANIIDKATKYHFATATYVFPLGPGCRVGVMGLTTQSTPQVTSADVSSLVFRDPVSTASDYIDDLVEQSEVRVALTHLGVSGDVRLVKQVDGFNVVVGGHDHVKPNEYCRETKGVTICQTPAEGRYLGRIDISVKNGKAFVEKTELIPVDKKAGKSKEIRGIIAPYLSSLDATMNQVVATVGRDLYHRPRGGQLTQVPLGIVAAEAMMSFAKSDAAFMNTGGMRKPLKKGGVTKGDIFKALPFQNYVGVLSLTGGEILKLIDAAEKKAHPTHPGPYLNWAGLDYKKIGGSYDITVGGKGIDSNKTYKVATVDFIANGGDGYTMLKAKEFKNSGKILRDVFESYIKINRI